MEFLNDNVLMLKVKSGELDKLGLLFTRYGKNLYGFYFRSTRDADLSEDLVQDVFERVLKYRHTYRGDGQFITWLYHLARNVMADHYKKVKKNAAKADLGKQEHKIAEHLSEDVYKKENDLQVLELALDYLSEDKKELILLSKFQGMKYREIAILLNCTEMNVKVKVFRAIQDLKDVFFNIQSKKVKI